MNKKFRPVTRRDFVALAAALPAIPFLKQLGVGSLLDQNNRVALSSGPLRYQLFFDEDQIDVLRDRYLTSSLYADLRDKHKSFDRAAERQFIKDEIQYNDHLVDLPRIGNAAPELAFRYLMTGDEDAAHLAVQLIEEILKFPKWDYFLEDGDQVFGLQRAPSSVVAISLCSDWLGDFVNTETRSRWIEEMGHKGNEPCFLGIYGMRYPDRVKGWTMDPTSAFFEHRPDEIIDLANWPYILDRTNLKAVPASALAIGAAAYELQFGRSKKTDRWIEQAAFSISSFGTIYAEDGSYDENLSYANYTSEHLAQGMEILARFRDMDLKDDINWPGFVDFMYGMAVPTNSDPYGIANFGDAGNGMMSGVPFWIANNFKDPRASWFGNTISRGHNVWSVIWNSDTPQIEPTSGPSLYRSELDWITARNGFAADDLVVAMRSGGPANHEHADRNSIIVKCFGEILVADPYRPPYSWADPSWPLRLTEGHSALLIDGKGHQYHDGREGTNPSDAVAIIVRSVQYGSIASWSSDATDAYRLVDDDVKSVMRTVGVSFDTNTVVIVDKVAKITRPSQISARYYAKNSDSDGSVNAANSHFEIVRPAASIDGYCYSSNGASAAAGHMDIPAERAAQHPFADATTDSAALEHTLITVLQPKRSGDMSIPVTFEHQGSTTTITVGEYQLEVTDEGPIPEFGVSN